ncbi:unnamed protein product [Kuraishia capsulata CBS 1993]|uniref:Glycylpeptide N-tetradecanoyltransferase n=1 Tax=Kuraishia capsulata CBS 1993 TaxID=1382522 RepID=W6MV84_9ASCO|nr:uncharacterized protein KUCA_T00005816001 [Kuraishia capsulata CBS 1993]CDK29822.1 unnamed protein product [Kuraishia capsulata CBS 1993]
MSDKKDDKAIGKKSIEEMLRMLAMGQSLSEPEQKQMADYKFWKTQPVARLDEKVDQEGEINVGKTPADVPAEPLPLLADFEWVTMDLTDAAETKQVYELLYGHYVEDQDATFRFAYSAEFFDWALKPPGWRRDWHVGVRVKASGKLVAFISAVPATLSVRDTEMKAVEINFLCIHKKLRAKRLAPVLIREITRRVNRQNIWQALYTVGKVLPSPVTTCRYYHRPLNWPNLLDVGFSVLPQGKTKAQMVAKYTIGLETKTPGWRTAIKKDIPQMKELFDRYQSRLELVQHFTEEELEHMLIDPHDTEKVVHCYVSETEGRITDFVSFYLLPFSVLDNATHEKLGVAYLFYYASEAGLDKPRFDPAGTKALADRLKLLVGDCLVVCKGLGVDVFNAVSSQDNALFLQDLKFGGGDGFLNFYLFNYKAFPIAGGIDEKTKEADVVKRSAVGVVML